MGAFGTGLFADDDALDARDAFLKLLAERQDISEATSEVLARSGVSLEQPGEDTAFILALAVTQWRNGWLDERLKHAAFEIIDQGLDLARWREARSSDREKRHKLLAKIRSDLDSPPRKARPLPPPPPIRILREQLMDLEIGEIVARRLPAGRLVLMKVVDFAEIAKWDVIAPVVRLLKWTSSEMPSAEEIHDLEELSYAIRPDGMSAFTKLSLATEEGEGFGDVIRTGWKVPVTHVPKSGLTTSECIGMKCTIDETLDHALRRWWDDPSLPADARPPWTQRSNPPQKGGSPLS